MLERKTYRFKIIDLATGKEVKLPEKEMELFEKIYEGMRKISEDPEYRAKIADEYHKEAKKIDEWIRESWKNAFTIYVGDSSLLNYPKNF